MKHTLHTCCLAALLLATACGEDRSGEYYARTQEDRWIEEVMTRHYLWYDKMPDIKESDFFAEPEEFLKKRVYNKALGGKGDLFSYIERKEEASGRIYMNRTSTYGFDFELLTDPLGTTSHTMARVLLVLPGSPAAQAGLKRGDWISAIDKEPLTVNNYAHLVQGANARLARESIVTAEDGEQVWEALDTVEVAASRPMELNPFYIDSIYHVDGKKIAYMMYNQFSTGPGDQPQEEEYGQQMLQLFSQFKGQSPDAFILDLRYNTGGYLSCAIQLASLLAPASALGKTCCTLERNDITDPQKVSLDYNAEWADRNLDLSKIYILTSEFTASASEAVINCLRPYMGDENVVLLGGTTYGKPVSMEAFEDERFDFILWPVTAYVLNAEGKADYERGIAPTYELEERSQLSLYPLGDTRELLLKNALSLITTGTVPDADQPETGLASRALYNSMSSRRAKGARWVPRQ